MKKRDPFTAIADPTRRRIIELVTTQGPQTMTQLSASFDISRPAVFKHVKLMAECGVLSIEPMGRERLATINYLELQKISIWLANYEKFWKEGLDRLGAYLEQ